MYFNHETKLFYLFYTYFSYNFEKWLYKVNKLQFAHIFPKSVKWRTTARVVMTWRTAAHVVVTPTPGPSFYDTFERILRSVFSRFFFTYLRSR